ncbi:hypothetical protein HanPI659440_Chr16g0654241 [Helianthus annuus]|nr:hypothetical protein HanPI659440_Chr16g0654241 [Helianthus annuus]
MRYVSCHVTQGLRRKLFKLLFVSSKWGSYISKHPSFLQKGKDDHFSKIAHSCKLYAFCHTHTLLNLQSC